MSSPEWDPSGSSTLFGVVVQVAIVAAGMLWVCTARRATQKGTKQHTLKKGLKIKHEHAKGQPAEAKAEAVKGNKTDEVQLVTAKTDEHPPSKASPERVSQNKVSQRSVEKPAVVKSEPKNEEQPKEKSKPAKKAKPSIKEVDKPKTNHNEVPKSVKDTPNKLDKTATTAAPPDANGVTSGPILKKRLRALGAKCPEIPVHHEMSLRPPPPPPPDANVVNTKVCQLEPTFEEDVTSDAKPQEL